MSDAKYRIYLCTGPDCCSIEEGGQSWKHLKRRLKQEGLHKGENCVAAKKTECMNVCGGGPVAAVYPGPVWYVNLTPEALDRVIAGHFKRGELAEDYRLEPPDDVRAPE